MSYMHFFCQKYLCNYVHYWDNFLLIIDFNCFFLGIPKYNCVVNPCKTLTNFEVPGFKADVMKAELGKHRI